MRNTAPPSRGPDRFDGNIDARPTHPSMEDYGVEPHGFDLGATQRPLDGPHPFLMDYGQHAWDRGAGGFGHAANEGRAQLGVMGFDDARAERHYHHEHPRYLGPEGRSFAGPPAAPRGPKGYRRSDERLLEEVHALLSNGEVDAGDVEVEVQGGEVILTGEVARREDRIHLEQLAASVRDVVDVRNHLRTRRH